MPDNPQPATALPMQCAPGPTSIVSPADSTDDEESLKRELALLTPANEKLLALADKSPPPPEWLDEDEELPF